MVAFGKYCITLYVQHAIYTEMRYAIIAAGEGSRLAQEGVAAPKPLVEIGGEPLIDRLIRIFMERGASSVAVICNDRTTAVADHLRRIASEGLNGRTVPLHLVVKSTPSSMHSFHELMPLLGEEPFVLTTVDTIFREDEFADYISAFLASDLDGLMAVTDFIDDEKPLYVATAADLSITAFNDANVGDRYISGGIYALRPAALATLRRCMAEGQSRMRNFQRGLVADGLRLKAYPMTKILDVDHAGDIAKAEAFLAAPRPESF